MADLSAESEDSAEREEKQVSANPSAQINFRAR